MKRRTWLAATIAACLLAGCGGDDDPTTATTDEPSTTSTAAPTTTDEPTTTLGRPCTDVPVPAAASEVSTAEGDVDGDGGPDVLRTYAIDGRWHLHAEIAAGGGADVALDIAPGGFAGVLGGADVDGDGADEIWARVGSGASATIVGLVRFDACSLQVVTLPSGEPVELPVGGSVGSPAGVSCEEAADLTAYAALLGDDDTYDVTVTPYELEGAALTPGTPTTVEVQMDDPDLAHYTALTCGSVGL